MKVRDAMTPNVQIMNPDETIAEAARAMLNADVGALPVGEGDRLVGMITDRDIAVRAVAKRKSPDTKIRDVMSREILYCFDDEDIEHVVSNMGDIQVRRLPVMDRNKRLVGIISLSDIALTHVPEVVGEGMAGVSEPGGQHRQAA